ncbi:MAG: DUF202 domain-containing protein [Planctomycetales bacterium]
MPAPSDPRTALAEERTELADYRTRLALDRTTLAWIRTTLTFATFGFGIAGFFRSLQEKYPSPHTARLHAGAVLLGIALLVLGIIAMILATISHGRTIRRLNRGQSPVLGNWPLSMTLGIMVAILSLVGLGCLFL